jgi:hypothetical protein
VAASRRYYIVAKKENDFVELFKLEQLSRSAVITSSLANRMVEVAGIHATHHPPTSSKSSRIVHISDSEGTDERIPLDPSADPIELFRMVVDLSDFDWEAAKPFRKLSYAEKWVHDVDQGGPYINALFYLGEPRRLPAMAEKALGEILVFIPTPDGFRTVPGGHEINFARLIFDDEAPETFMCLLLSCYSPGEAPASSYKPWAGQQLSWIAYSRGSQVARGTLGE